jgi:hypothetical protein
MHHSQTASRVFSGEAVIISPTENVVRMLNPVGSRVWELADGTRTVEDISVVLTTEFEVDLPQARASVAAFVEELTGKGLLTPA